MAAKEAINGAATIVVMPGDHPLVSEQTIKDLLAVQAKTSCVMALATLRLPNFSGDFKVCERAGRIIRSADGSVQKIVEYKDASEEEKKITEVNPSYYAFDGAWLWSNISKIQPNNAAKEYYLTDLLGIATSQGYKVQAVEIQDPFEGIGVNNPEELAIVERYIKNL
jgi:bifunctional UDP-N-acetylglucosamine pyrophosphorylase/glucosamine-1-phosphate N-acetyltransferase